ncbi:hypothetical protein Hypma_011314 [Hypsizygus marmoreus]|uniref:Uncharacterized protein n=1 Tax=Hypsizygus marmoreus TaxID=39966 RepID=A0A369JFM0_HYPMA|nr:hypothetical protein Hypma_011314 [Hypsizygus marmoreus]
MEAEKARKKVAAEAERECKKAERECKKAERECKKAEKQVSKPTQKKRKRKSTYLDQTVNENILPEPPAEKYVRPTPRPIGHALSTSEHP